LEHQIRNRKIEWIPVDESKRNDIDEEKIDVMYNFFIKNNKKEER
jgi:hypothetical protein